MSVITPGAAVEQQEPLRAEQHRDLRGEQVVVAEADLVGRGRIVLVQDRHRTQLEQRPQRGAHVEVGAPVCDLGGGQQHLRRVQAVRVQGAVPERLQPRLAECRGGLQLRQARAAAPIPAAARPRAIAPDETTQTGVPACTERRDLGRGRGHHLAARLTVGIDDQRRPELDDDRRGSHGGYLRWVPSPTTRS